MKGHLDADILAEYRAGLITGRRGRGIAAHLSGCAACTALGARLAQVSVLLAAAPAPALPDALTRRIDSALAAAAESPDFSKRTVVPPPSPARGAGRHRFAGIRLRVLAPAAAGLVLLAGAVYGLSQLQSGSTSSTASSSGSAPAAGPANVPAAGLAPSGSARHAVAGGSNGSAPVVYVASDTDYQPATLRQQLTAQLAARPSLRAVPAPAGLSACVRRITNGSPRLLVEQARYRGAPATVVVESEGAGERALVAGANCSATDSDIIASTVLSTGISTP